MGAMLQVRGEGLHFTALLFIVSLKVRVLYVFSHMMLMTISSVF